MKKYRFIHCAGVQRGERSEIVEFDDDATEEEIQANFEEWVWQEIGDEFTYEEVQP